jgi:hypothetical protein
MSIPFNAIPSTVRRASETERDQAALALVGYVSGILTFSPEDISDGYREGLIQRINKVRQTQGIDRITFVNETAARIRAAVEPDPAFVELEATLAELVKEPS